MSEKIVQFNEEIIKGQIKELVRGSVEETLNELHACSKKFEFYCLTSREACAPAFCAEFAFCSITAYMKERAESAFPLKTGAPRCVRFYIADKMCVSLLIPNAKRGTMQLVH